MMYKALDPEKPTLVHCAVGGRSRVAAQMLSGWGFKEVYNLAGGIKAFEGHKATGPRELNLDLVTGRRNPGGDHGAGLRYGKGPAALLRNLAAASPRTGRLQGLFR